MQHLLLSSTNQKPGRLGPPLVVPALQPPVVTSAVQLTGFQASFLDTQRLGGDIPTQVVLSLWLNGNDVRGLLLPLANGTIDHAWTALMPRFDSGSKNPSLGLDTMTHATTLPSPVSVHRVEVDCRVFQDGVDVSSRVITWSDSVSVGLRLIECGPSCNNNF